VFYFTYNHGMTATNAHVGTVVHMRQIHVYWDRHVG